MKPTDLRPLTPNRPTVMEKLLDLLLAVFIALLLLWGTTEWFMG